MMAKLDLKSAYNGVDYLAMLEILQEMKIPPIYGRYYFAFLRDWVLNVQQISILSKCGHERCGTPQGVASPL